MFFLPSMYVPSSFILTLDETMVCLESILICRQDEITLRVVLVKVKSFLVLILVSIIIFTLDLKHISTHK